MQPPAAGARRERRRQCGGRIGRIADDVVGPTRDNGGMTLQRAAWIITVAALLIGALIMLLSDYRGYAALFAAVAVSAAINLK